MSPQQHTALAPAQGLGVMAMPHSGYTRANGKAVFGNVMAAHFVPKASEAIINRTVDNVLAPFFRATLEDYVMGVMAIDFVALFIPRSWKALMRSAKNYNPQEDPEAMKRTGLDEKLYIFKERMKRLNWSNFVEEFSRELCGGPGLFIPTAILYGVFRTQYGKSSVQLHGDTLKKFADRFAQHAGGKETKFNPAEYNEEKFKALKNSFIHELIDFENLAGPSYPKEELAQDKAKLKDWVQRFTATLDDKPEYGSRLTFWKDKKVIEEYKNWTAKRDALEAELESTIKSIRSKNPDRHIYRFNRIPLVSEWVSGDKVIKADNFATRVTQWNDFTNTVKEQWKKTNGHLGDALQHVFNKVKRLKGVYFVATVIATMSALLAGVYVFQHHNEYPANSSVRLQDLDVNREKRYKAKKQANHQIPDSMPLPQATPALNAVERQVSAIKKAEKTAQRKADNVIVHANTGADLSTLPPLQNELGALPFMPSVNMVRSSNGMPNVVSFSPLTPRNMYKHTTPSPTLPALPYTNFFMPTQAQPLYRSPVNVYPQYQTNVAPPTQHGLSAWGVNA